jgi:hypothetical protein
MTLPPRMLRAWRATAYTLANGAVVRIGRRSPDADRALERLGARCGAIVTAWNPLGRRRPEGWNRRAGARLAAAARRIAAMPAEGRLGAWVEEGLLLAGDPRRAIGLARRFRQGGIVVLGRGRPARLLLLPPCGRVSPPPPAREGAREGRSWLHLRGGPAYSSL